MQRRTVLAIALLTVLASSWSATAAHASSVNYAVHDGEVSVELSVQIYQNATAMPGLSERFIGTAAQDLSSSIEKSLRSKADDISVSSLSGELRSDGHWANVSIRFDVNGVASQSGGVLSANCSWIRFTVSDDLKLGNLSYNQIGATYVRPVFEKYMRFAESPLNETIRSVEYQIGREDTDASLAVQSAGNMTLLDFGNLVPPIENWEMKYNMTEGMTVWTYDLAPATDLTMIVIPIEGTEFAAHAFYKYNATFSADGLAEAQADTIRIDVSSGLEPLLMLATVLVTLVVAIATSWVYRSRRKQLPRRRR